jgi:hypothetical protein
MLPVVLLGLPTPKCRASRRYNLVVTHAFLPRFALLETHGCLPRFALLETHGCLPRFALLETHFAGFA